MTAIPTRASMTVAVLVSDDKRRRRDLLDQLASQLEAYDNLVLVGPHHDPGQHRAWREPRAGGGLTVPSARPRVRDLVLVLDERIQPSDGLLDQLAAAMTDPFLGAVSARSNVADGDELVLGVAYEAGDLAGRHSILRSWAATHEEVTTPAVHLGGPCVLLRRQHLEAVGGIDALRSDKAVPNALAAARGEGLAFAIAERAYVHHPGGHLRQARDGWPLVSACLIVKDEQDNLATCLASAAGIADEVVVYDTGSIDETVTLARSLGALVVEGTWDSDFARARNAALDACRGQWILWLDADETLRCEDRGGLVHLLEETSSEVEGYVVLIDNLQGTEAATALPHPAVRLFRRSACRWEGRLHEQVMRRHDGRPPALVPLEAARIEHRGYLHAALRARGKGARNLRSAFSDLVGGSGRDLGQRLLNLARSYVLAGDPETGVDLAQRARELAGDPTTLRLALRTLAEGYGALGRHDDALAAADEIRRSTARPVLADLVEAHVHLERNEPEAALAALSRLREVVVDDDGFEYRPSLAAGPRANALVALGRHEEAAEVLLATLREDGGLDTHLGLLVDAVFRAGRDPADIYEALPGERVRAFLPQLLQLQPDAADQVLEAWYGRDPASLSVLATATQLAARLPIARQLAWSARLRQAGLATSCPLVHSAVSDTLVPADRAIAAAVAWASFADPRARVAFVANALQVDRANWKQLRAGLAALAPGLAHELDALQATPPPPPTPRPGPDATPVVVVGRCSGTLREAALALELARLGHEVTLLQPDPPSRGPLLGEHHVALACWPEDDPGAWEGALLATLAHRYATGPIRALVLGAGTGHLEERVRQLLPVSEVRHDAPADEQAGVPAPLSALLGSPPPTPLAHRRGVCLLADLRGDRSVRSAFTSKALALLREALPDAPLAHCGDDPAAILQDALPALIEAGPATDPTGWLRAARVALVDGGSDPASWLELADLCGTPVVVAHDGAFEQALGSLATLLRDERAWQEASEAATARARGRADTASPAVEPFGVRARPHPARSRRDRRPLVRIASPVGGLDSLAQVNRELARHLNGGSRSFDVVVATPEHLPLTGPVASALAGVPVYPLATGPAGDVEIRHQWPPDFRRPRQGALVCIQPFEFGGLPEEWIGPLRDSVDELWVPTPWVRQCAVDSGVAPGMVHVVANGVDIAVFRPEGPRYPLRTQKKTKFLFVGGCIERKGIDVLLQSYLGTFSAVDDVCLVVKPYGSGGVYRTSSLETEVRQAAANGGAEIEVVEEDLAAPELAALYRSCDALVHPFRGEGFALPVAEAMASGLPVVVTEGGACDAYCDAEVGWLVPARRIPIATSEWTTSKAGAWWLEPSRAALASALRCIVDHPVAARERGAAGAARIAGRLTWEHAADQAAARIEALLHGAPGRSTTGERTPLDDRPRRAS